eukprot:1566689-Pleurochrysis_carterae.AAC.1
MLWPEHRDRKCAPHIMTEAAAISATCFALSTVWMVRLATRSGGGGGGSESTCERSRSATDEMQLLNNLPGLVGKPPHSCVRRRIDGGGAKA